MMKMSENVKKNKVKIDEVRYAAIHLYAGMASTQNCGPSPKKKYGLDLSPWL